MPFSCQDEKIRRHNDWSKWIPASRHHTTQNSSTAEVQFPTGVESTEATDKNSLVIPHDNNGPKATDKDQDECLSSTSNVSRGEASLDRSMANLVLTAGESLTCNGELEDKCKKFASESFSGSEINSGCGSMVQNVSAASISVIEKSGAYNSLTSESLHGKADLTSIANSEPKNSKTQSDGSRHLPDLGGLSNGFMDDCPSFTGEPSTFLLDEELDLEHTTLEKDHLSPSTR